jgi:hypothetical protein
MDKKEFLARWNWFVESNNVEDSIKKAIFGEIHRYIQSSYPPYHFSGFLPVRVGRFHSIELPRYVLPGIYPIYSYIPSFQLASILVWPQNINLPSEHQISIPEGWCYELEVILDNLTLDVLNQDFSKYDLNIFAVYPQDGAGSDYPPIKFAKIPILLALYFSYEIVKSDPNSTIWYVMKPFVIFPAIRALHTVWENPYQSNK